MRRSLPILVALALATGVPAWPQISIPGLTPAPQSSTAPQPDVLGRNTPKGTVLGFLHSAQAGDYTRAARYLKLKANALNGPELASQLKAVLDRGLVANLDRISGNPGGSENDSLPPNRERIGTIASGSGSVDIVLSRVPGDANDQIWLFSSETLERIPPLYEEIARPAIEKYLPALLLIHTRFWSARLWQLLAFLLAIPLAFLIASLITRIFSLILHPIIEYITKESARDRMKTVTGPIRLIVLVLVMRSGTYLLELPILARQIWIRIVGVLAIAAVAWLLIRLIELSAQLTLNRLLRRSQPGNMAIVHLVRRLLKACALGLAALWILQTVGVNLTPYIAGISLVGIAIALAAQKTLENLFGGIMLLTDEPARIGDYCKFGAITGHVEDIGLRSTRFRTRDRTVVAVPNGQLSAMSIENYSIRDKIWFHPAIGLRYETTADQLRFVLAEIRRLLYAHPRIETSTARVRFVKYGDSSLDLEVSAYVPTRDYTEFLEVQEDLLLRIMDIVEGAGSGFAFPSQTVYFGKDGGLDSERSHTAAEKVDQWRRQNALPFPDFHPEEIAGMENRIEYPPPDSARHGS